MLSEPTFKPVVGLVAQPQNDSAQTQQIVLNDVSNRRIQASGFTGEALIGQGFLAPACQQAIRALDTKFLKDLQSFLGQQKQKYGDYVPSNKTREFLYLPWLLLSEDELPTTKTLTGAIDAAVQFDESVTKIVKSTGRRPSVFPESLRTELSKLYGKQAIKEYLQDDGSYLYSTGIEIAVKLHERLKQRDEVLRMLQAAQQYNQEHPPAQEGLIRTLLFLETGVKTARSELETAEKTDLKIQGTIAVKLAEKETSQAMVTKLQGKSQNVETVILSTNSSITELKEKVAEQEQKNQALGTEINTQTSACSTATVQVENARKELERLKTVEADLEKKGKAVESKIFSAQSTRKYFKEQKEAMDAQRSPELERVEDQIRAIDEALSQAKSVQKKNLIEQREAALALWSVLKQQKADLPVPPQQQAAEIALAEDRHKAAENAFAELRQREAEAIVALSKLIVQKQDVTEKQLECKAKQVVQTTQLTQLQSVEAQSKNALSDLQNRKSISESTLHDLQKEERTTNTQLGNLQSQAVSVRLALIATQVGQESAERALQELRASALQARDQVTTAVQKVDQAAASLSAAVQGVAGAPEAKGDALVAMLTKAAEIRAAAGAQTYSELREVYKSNPQPGQADVKLLAYLMRVEAALGGMSGTDIERVKAYRAAVEQAVVAVAGAPKVPDAAKAALTTVEAEYRKLVGLSRDAVKPSDESQKAVAETAAKVKTRLDVAKTFCASAKKALDAAVSLDLLDFKQRSAADMTEASDLRQKVQALAQAEADVKYLETQLQAREQSEKRGATIKRMIPGDGFEKFLGKYGLSLEDSKHSGVIDKILKAMEDNNSRERAQKIAMQEHHMCVDRIVTASGSSEFRFQFSLATSLAPWWTLGIGNQGRILDTSYKVYQGVLDRLNDGRGENEKYQLKKASSKNEWNPLRGSSRTYVLSKGDGTTIFKPLEEAEFAKVCMEFSEALTTGGGGWKHDGGTAMDVQRALQEHQQPPQSPQPVPSAPPSPV